MFINTYHVKDSKMMTQYDRKELLEEQTERLDYFKTLIKQLNKELKEAKYGKMRTEQNIEAINNGEYD
jgi:ribonuclease HII